MTRIANRAAHILIALGLTAAAAHGRRPPGVQESRPAWHACGLDAPPSPRVDVHFLQSNELAKRLCYLVIRPPGDGPSPEDRLPVLVLLHGLGGKPGDWLKHGHIQEHLDAAVAAGVLPRTLAAIPSGENGYWTDWIDGKHPYGGLVLEMLMAVRQHYAARSGPAHTAIAGYSMGGFGALSLGLRHPELFGTIVALSPTDMRLALKKTPRRKTYTRVFGSPARPELLARTNPLDLVRAGKGQGQMVLLAHGSKEPDKFAKGTRRLQGAMARRGLRCALRAVPGGVHGWKTWGGDTQRWWIGLLGERWSAPAEDGPGAAR